MLLNNLPQQFAISFPVNFFYPEINETWLPVLKRMGTPYWNLEDMMNAQVQSITFPSVSQSPRTQQAGLYQVNKREGKALDQIINKEFTLTFKLTESYMSYFIARMQFEYYMHLTFVKPLFMGDIHVDLLDDAGFSNIEYCFRNIQPTSLSDLSLSYAAKVASYNTFTWQFKYNYFDIWFKDEQGHLTNISPYEGEADIPDYNENLLNKINSKKP